MKLKLQIAEKKVEENEKLRQNLITDAAVTIDRIKDDCSKLTSTLKDLEIKNQDLEQQKKINESKVEKLTNTLNEKNMIGQNFKLMENKYVLDLTNISGKHVKERKELIMLMGDKAKELDKKEQLVQTLKSEIKAQREALKKKDKVLGFPGY